MRIKLIIFGIIVAAISVAYFKLQSKKNITESSEGISSLHYESPKPLKIFKLNEEENFVSLNSTTSKTPPPPCDTKEIGRHLFKLISESYKSEQFIKPNKSIDNSNLNNFSEHVEHIISFGSTENDRAFLSFVIQKKYDLALSQISESNTQRNSLVAKSLSVNPELPHNVIYNFEAYSNGLTFSDLVALVKLKYSNDLIYNLISNSSIDLTKYWIENGKAQSLALLAATNLNFELFEYFYNERSPLMEDSPSENIYKRVTIPKNEKERIEALKIVSFLSMNINHQPSQSSLNYLNQWLDEKELAQIFPHISIEPYKKTKNSFYKEMEELKKIYNNCTFDDNEIKSIEDILRIVKQEDKQYIKEKILGNNKFDFMEIHPQKTNQLLLLMHEGLWSDSLLLADNIYELTSSKSIYSFAIEMSILLRAPDTHLEEILSRGGYLRHEFILEIVALDDLYYLTTVDKIGVDWAKSLGGINALHIANAYSVSQEVILFLHDKNVPLIPDGRGLLSSDYKKRN